MPAQPQHTLGQQFGRFLVTGALVFTLAFWLTSSFALSSADARHDWRALNLLAKGLTTQSFGQWLQDLHQGYLPFFLGQRPLVISYIISAPLAWFAAFLYDMKILRKENML